MAGDAAPRTGALLCENCFDDLPLIDGPACRRCAAPLPTTLTDAARCIHCRGRRLGFQAACAAGRYSGLLRDLLLRMKRAEGDRLSLAIGELMWKQCNSALLVAGVDVVVPVPMHWRRRLAHGTNSAAVLAEVLSRRMRAPLAARLLRRLRNTAPQFDLSPPQRRANVRGAFSAGKGYPIARAHVLLVDDIMTSGATCNEAARTLRTAGASRVTVAVVARAAPA